MSTQTLITAAEFEKMADRLGPCELVRGEVVTLSPGGFEHSRVTANLVVLLGQWARRTNSGRVLAGEMGLIVEPDPGTVRGADVAYYSTARLGRGPVPCGFSKIPPDLVAEIVGRGQTWRDMVEKVSEYLRMGVDRIWVIDPNSKRVHVYRPDAEPRMLGGEDTLADEALLPGFACKVAELFED